MLKFFSLHFGQNQYNPDEANDGFVDESNYEDYLVDDIENNQEDDLQQDTYEPQAPNYMEEIPTGNQLLGVPEDSQEITYANPIQLVYDGVDNNEVISFQYTNRHGNYSGLRTVEPHYTFIAGSTGNEVLVTYDRDVNDIRAFIVSNIHPNGVRYKNVRFQDRPEIMRGII